MCSESCGGVREHKEFECAAFREKGYKVSRMGIDLIDLPAAYYRVAHVVG